jgi:hypothetical protein
VAGRGKPGRRRVFVDGPQLGEPRPGRRVLCNSQIGRHQQQPFQRQRLPGPSPPPFSSTFITQHLVTFPTHLCHRAPCDLGHTPPCDFCHTPLPPPFVAQHLVTFVKHHFQNAPCGFRHRAPLVTFPTDPCLPLPPLSPTFGIQHLCRTYLGPLSGTPTSHIIFVTFARLRRYASALALFPCSKDPVILPWLYACLRTLLPPLNTFVLTHRHTHVRAHTPPPPPLPTRTVLHVCTCAHTVLRDRERVR